MESSITVENLAKSYQLGTAQHPMHATLRDALVSGAKKFWNSCTGRPSLAPTEQDTLWALKGLNFEIGQGEIVGIIGKNGAGKSTLLKILSRITEPTQGHVVVNGRLASLLEVGTGFHPELTGRENIFLNGAILGMRRAEIKRKFDEIVSFSEIERFIDTPVKRYSSGMYVRLAFSVAAHLEPDILVIDEVLAVGDVGFQRKCTGTMKDVAQGNRTVLFVTHNLQLVRSLCTRAILIDQGSIVQDGPVENVLSTYVKGAQSNQQFSNQNLGDRLRRASGDARFEEIKCEDSAGKEKWTFPCGQTVRFKLSYKVFKDVPSLGLSFNIVSTVSGEILANIRRAITTSPVRAGAKGIVSVDIPNIPFRPGDYSLYIAIGHSDFSHWFDTIDQNVNLPLLTLTSEERDPLAGVGYFNVPAEVKNQTF